MSDENDKSGIEYAKKKSKVSYDWRREVTARVMANTGNMFEGLIAAGYKPTKTNLLKRKEMMSKDPKFQRRLMDLIAEAYPVTERSSAMVELTRLGVEAARNSGKVSDIKTMIEVLSKISGMPSETPSAPQIHRHQHVVLPGAPAPQPIEVVQSAQLPITNSSESEGE